MPKIYRLEYFVIVAAVAASLSVPVFTAGLVMAGDNDTATATSPAQSSTVRTLGTLRMDEINNPAIAPSGATPALPGTMADISDQPLQPTQANGITYVTGGIGDEEREQLDGMKQNFNLRIVSAGTNGEYAGNTHVVISDSRGNELLNVPAGPIFYAELTPGNYTVEALSEGQKQRHTVKISGKKSSFVHFTWH